MHCVNFEFNGTLDSEIKMDTKVQKGKIYKLHHGLFAEQKTHMISDVDNE